MPLELPSCTNSFICTQLNGSKYCYVILIIQFNSHLFVTQFQVGNWLNNFIDGILKGTTIPGQSGPESNGNIEAIRIPQRTWLESHHQVM